MIWIFGESFSERFSDFKKPCGVTDYVEWKGYSPKMHYDYLSEDYKQDLNIQSLGGMCNDWIFSKFIECYDQIKEDDIVLFGWTDITRFSVPHKNIWYSCLFKDNILSQDTINEIKISRLSYLQTKRQVNNIEFINKILSKNIVVHWTWSTVPTENILSIQKETNNLIIDMHYGEEGQYDLYLRIKEKLKTTDKVKIDLWEPDKRPLI